MTWPFRKTSTFPEGTPTFGTSKPVYNYRNSRNGTFVNETKLTDTGYILTSGDRIRIGNSTFEVRLTEQP